MRGLSYSALSYAPHLKGKTVAIIGDGKLALRAAAEMSLTADHVHLVGPSAKVLDAPLGRKLRSASNVTIAESSQVTEMLGDDYVRSIIVCGAGDHKTEFQADLFFVELSIIPNSQPVAGLVDLSPMGLINIDERNRTNAPGIFAAGDVSNTYMEQFLVAMGGGVKATLSAYEYLLPNL